MMAASSVFISPVALSCLLKTGVAAAGPVHFSRAPAWLGPTAFWRYVRTRIRLLLAAVCVDEMSFSFQKRWQLQCLCFVIPAFRRAAYFEPLEPLRGACCPSQAPLARCPGFPHTKQRRGSGPRLRGRKGHSRCRCTVRLQPKQRRGRKRGCCASFAE